MDMSQVNEGSNRFSIRSSGRVGGANVGSTRMFKSMNRRDPSSINDILVIYARLLELQDKDDSELKCAISYGLKLWNLRKRKHKEGKADQHNASSQSQNDKARTKIGNQSNSLH